MVCKIILKKKKKKSNDLVYHIDVLPLELHLFLVNYTLPSILSLPLWDFVDNLWKK